MENVLLKTIRDVLKDVHIESGRTEEFDRVCKNIERAVSIQVLRMEVDYYTEANKEWANDA